ncbi:hypothetical protein [Streptomyces sp. NPDC047024]|uniref:hypothetical protein n=1 Tax=Streptomyces sp. NPDC047024 TaxID=3155476 RepID=UPI00340DD20C
MGLHMVVGVLDGAEDEYVEMVRADFAAIGELLKRAGAGPWVEPGQVDVEDTEFEMWGYSGLHTVRRLAVHLAAHGRLPEPLPSDGSRRASEDPLLNKVYEGLPGERPEPFDHLVHHADHEGYYVPVDFARVITGAPGGPLGSSVRLLAETRRIAAALGLPEDLDPDSEEVFEASDAEEPAAEGWQRYGVESYVCLQLIRTARLSIATGAAIALV